MSSLTLRLGRPRRVPSTWPNYLVLIALAAFSLGPLVILVFNSLKYDAEIRLDPLGPPVTPRWDNYQEAWVYGDFATTMVNSLIIAAGTVLGVVVISGLAGYSLARLRPIGGDVITFYLLVGTTLPAQLFLVPLFYLWSKLGLTNNLLGLIILYWGIMSPFPTFLLRSYMVAIPQDFEDAALVDGASRWQVLWRIFIPLSWPGFLTVILLTALGAYHEFLFAITMIQKAELMPVATSLYYFSNRWIRSWGPTNSGAIIMSVPVIIIFLLLQRRFIEGLTQGGLK